MKERKSEGKVYDYVFGDLTDIPISKAPIGELWDFMRQIISLGTSLRKPGTGKYMTHVCETFFFYVEYDKIIFHLRQQDSSVTLP